MSSDVKFNLPSNADYDIMLTTNERRILTNIRRWAKTIDNGDIACLITIRDGQIAKGILCLGKGPESNIRL
jgi:hypothetical protein